MERLTKNYQLYTCKKPKGIVIFLHGAMEHYKRYEDFFAFLNANNFIVATYNHPGHGIDANSAHKIEHIYELEQRAVELKIELDNCYPNLDHHIIGHSMGSLVARNLVNHREYDFDKIVLIGTPNPSSFKIDSGLNIIKMLIKIQGPNHVSKLANMLCFGEFAFKMQIKYHTKNWINSDKEEFIKYKNDPLCCNPFSNNYIYALLEQSKKAIQSSNIATIKSHEYLVLNGTHDPVNAFGKELNRFSNLHRIDYQKMRHELLFESQRLLVYNDIITFLNK